MSAGTRNALLQPRRPHVNYSTLRQASGQFTLEVSCSGGTYIRTLIVDIARAVSSAAHMSALRRTAHGPFDLDRCGVQPVCLDELSNAPLLLKAIEEARRVLEILPSPTESDRVD